jgi:hypothetical protein
MNNLRFQQYIHLILLFIAIFLYFFANKINSKGSEVIDNLKMIIEIGGFGWSALLIVIAVRHGIGIDFPKKVFNAYRQSLGKIRYVCSINLLLLIAVIGLSYYLAWYRDIDFISNKEADLILNDKPGEVVVMAKLEKDKPTSVRLRRGLRLLVARSGDELVSIDALYIYPIWKKQKITEVKVSFAEHTYEKTL